MPSLEEIVEPLKWLIVILASGVWVWIAIQIGEFIYLLPIPTYIATLITLLIVVVGIYLLIGKLK